VKRKKFGQSKSWAEAWAQKFKIFRHWTARRSLDLWGQLEAHSGSPGVEVKLATWQNSQIAIWTWETSKGNLAKLLEQMIFLLYWGTYS
jgi:hypothetical protein